MIHCQFCHCQNEEGTMLCARCQLEVATPAVLSVDPLPLEAGELAIDPANLDEPASVEVSDGLGPGLLTIAIEPMWSLLVICGRQIAVAYPLYDGQNVIGRAERLVDSAEPPERTWQHIYSAKIDGELFLELRSELERVLEDFSQNVIGRADKRPVDVDLDDQEPPEGAWCSQQHACIEKIDGALFLEDLNSANGTYVNHSRIYPGQRRSLAANDVIQVGAIQLRVTCHD